MLGAKLALNPKCPLCVKGGWRTALCVRGDCEWHLHIPAWIFYSNKALAISFLCATISCEIWRSFKARGKQFSECVFFPLPLVATRVFVNPLLNARVRLYARLLLFSKIFYFAKSFREPCFPFQNSSYPPSPLFFKGNKDNPSIRLPRLSASL